MTDDRPNDSSDGPPVFLPEPKRPEPELVQFPPSGATRGQDRTAQSGSRGQQMDPTQRRKGGIPTVVLLLIVIALIFVSAREVSFWPFLAAIGVFLFIMRRARR
ncbi:hypothetical protein MASR1M32_41000 [Rhodobacter sp.]